MNITPVLLTSDALCAYVKPNDKLVRILITVTYALPSLLLYAHIIRLVVKNQKKMFFKSSFYRLFVFNSILSILAFLIDFFFNRLMAAGFFCRLIPLISPVFSAPLVTNQLFNYKLSPFLTVFYFSSYFFVFAALISATFITVNRLTAVVCPVIYQRLWSRLLPLSYLFSLLIPLFCVWHLLLSPAYFVLLDESSIAMAYVETVPWIRNSQSSTVLAVITGVLKGVCSLSTYVILKNRKGLGPNRNEIDLFFVGAGMAVAAEIYAINQFVIYYVVHINFDYFQYVFSFAYKFRSYSTDLFILSPPWFLLFMSRIVRKNTVNMFRRNKQSTVLHNSISHKISNPTPIYN